VELDRLP
jgi:hypothetical protein